MTEIVVVSEETRPRKAFWPTLPVSVNVAFCWIALMLLLACFSEVIAPYGLTKLDLRN